MWSAVIFMNFRHLFRGGPHVARDVTLCGPLELNEFLHNVARRANCSTFFRDGPHVARDVTLWPAGHL